MNGRVYDYNVGRFTSVDPLIQGHGNSQGLQPYSYVMNNPLGYTDPTGYRSDSICGSGDTCGSAFGFEEGPSLQDKVNHQEAQSAAIGQIPYANNGALNTQGAISHSSSEAIRDLMGEGDKAKANANQSNETAPNSLYASNNEIQPETLADRFANANDKFKSDLDVYAQEFPYESEMLKRYATNIDTTNWAEGEIGFQREMEAILNFEEYLIFHTNNMFRYGLIKKEAVSAFPDKLKSEIRSSLMQSARIPSPVGSMAIRFYDTYKAMDKIEHTREKVNILKKQRAQVFNKDFVEKYY